jgi:uncharacterized protein DUF6665
MDRLAALQYELHQEMASSLGRVARKLEALLERCAELAAAGAAGEYRAAWEQANLHLWYLIVQREAMGFRDHTRVYETYRLPPRRLAQARWR